jgi:helicase MOV-10
MADSKTNIVLSGDPKQLGPIIRSGVARELGLEMSYLERLMDRDAYDLKKGYGKRYSSIFIYFCCLMNCCLMNCLEFQCDQVD